MERPTSDRWFIKPGEPFLAAALAVVKLITSEGLRLKAVLQTHGQQLAVLAETGKFIGFQSFENSLPDR